MTLTAELRFLGLAQDPQASASLIAHMELHLICTHQHVSLLEEIVLNFLMKIEMMAIALMEMVEVQTVQLSKDSAEPVVLYLLQVYELLVTALQTLYVEIVLLK